VITEAAGGGCSCKFQNTTNGLWCCLGVGLRFECRGGGRVERVHLTSGNSSLGWVWVGGYGMSLNWRVWASGGTCVFPRLG